MKLTTDFESGNGRLTRLDQGGASAGDQSWRLDAVGDLFGYNRYFCVQIDNRGGAVANLKLEISPDPTLTNSHFLSHFPSDLWYCAHDDWRRWIRVRNTWEQAVRFHEDRIELNLRVDANTLLHVATNPPWRCSDFVKWVESLQDPRVRVESIGTSVENRAIHALGLGAQNSGKPRLLVLAGMHASEHGGVWACRGIVEYLLSSIAAARRITEAFDIAIVPMLNPDGNVHGCSGGSTQRLTINNSVDFTGVSSGATPLYRENEILWRWLNERFPPEVLLHFHGFMGRWRFGDEPCDGLYGHENIDAVYSSDGSRRAYRAMLDRLRFQTPAYSGHWFLYGAFPQGMLDVEVTQKFGTLSLLYEVNCSTVGIAKWLPTFMQNPVFVAGHLYLAPDGKSTVIGRWLDLQITQDGLEGTAKFLADDELGDNYWKRYSQSMQSAVSVGWITHAYEMRELQIDGKKQMVRVFTEVELIEISAVVIPANRECVAKHLAANAASQADAEHAGGSLLDAAALRERIQSEIRSSLKEHLHAGPDGLLCNLIQDVAEVLHGQRGFGVKDYFGDICTHGTDGSSDPAEDNDHEPDEADELRALSRELAQARGAGGAPPNE